MESKEQLQNVKNEFENPSRPIVILNGIIGMPLVMSSIYRMNANDLKMKKIRVNYILQ